MPIFASALKEFVPCPEGQFAGVICDVVDHGIVESGVPGWPARPVIDIRVQVDEEDGEGRRFLVIARLTNSLHPKAGLRKFVEAARGKALTKDELKRLDLETLIGLQVQIAVTHRVQESTGITFANISAVMPAAKGAARLTPLDYTRVVDRPAVNGGGVPNR